MSIGELPVSDVRDWNKSIDTIIELERQGAPATMEQRVAELFQVCRDAAAMQAQIRSHRAAPDKAPESWPRPKSTDAFLRANAQAIHGE